MNQVNVQTKWPFEPKPAKEESDYDIDDFDDEYQEEFDDSDWPSTKKSIKQSCQPVKKETFQLPKKDESPVKPFAFAT